MSGGHDISTGRENGGTVRDRGRVTKMDGVRTGDESAGGTRIKKDMGSGWAGYRGERQCIRNDRQRMHYRIP